MTLPDEKLTPAARTPPPPEALLRPLPSRGIKSVLALLEDEGLPVDRALVETGVSRQRVDDPAGRITVAQELALLRRLVPLTGDRCFGLRAGACYRLHLFGALGAAVQAAASARDAFNLFLRYLRLSYTHFQVDLETGARTTALAIRPTFSLGGLHDYYLLRDLAFTVTACQELAPELSREGLAGIRLGMSADAATQERLRAFFDCPVTFNAPHTRVLMYNSVLATPLPFSNAHMRDVLEEQCRRDLDQLDEHQGLAERIRALLHHDTGLITSERELAQMLAMTPRTLRRHLSAVGTGFQTLRDEVRQEQARTLLQSTDLSVAQIADSLGYSEAAPFVRAFRRWTGTTPRRYRAGG